MKKKLLIFILINNFIIIDIYSSENKSWKNLFQTFAIAPYDPTNDKETAPYDPTNDKETAPYAPNNSEEKKPLTQKDKILQPTLCQWLNEKKPIGHKCPPYV